MRTNTRIWHSTFGTLLVSVLALASPGQAYAEENTAGKQAPAAATLTESQARANEILMRMAEFLGGKQHFSFTVHGGYDAVQESGQKIEFSETRKFILNRPGQLRIEDESDDGVKKLIVFDGKEITLVDAASNVYATEPQPGTVDETIVHFVKDLGMRLPLAALLISKLPEALKKRVQTIDYVEMTNIHGKPSHHLAARTDTVDFQVWVSDGDIPLPLRIVLTYKNAPGEPQFRAQLSDWNLEPKITDSTFSVKVPDGAQKIAFAAQLPRLSAAANPQPSENSGAK